ncbi:ATP-grasp domain-containing protein [Patescibacteria group bacterium]|nr:ATP-grasp domain-containing protein [Patescibacteria group bacterium]
MQTLPSSLRIGVLRGGPSSEYDVSMKSGENILKQLSETHRPVDIFISKDKKWHVQGLERSPERILKNVDVVFNALHGEYGEDGQVQDILDHHGVPYTGSLRYPSSIAMNKWLSKEKVMKEGIKTPVSVLFRPTEFLTERAREISGAITFPMVVKPVKGGSSIGITIVQNEAQLITALQTSLINKEDMLVEECIKGKEATCGVVDGLRDQPLYALPSIEVISKQNREVCPGNFSQAEKKELERLSKLVHQTLGLRHYSRSDFIVSPRRGIYFLEVNTLPGLTKESLLPKSLEAVGISTKDFLHHVLSLALNRK